MSAINERAVAAREKLLRTKRESEAAIHVARAELEGIQLCCPHPPERTQSWETSCMGDPGTHWKCLDCLKERNT